MNSTELQSTTTIAGSPNGVLEPVATILEKHGLVRRGASMLLYRCRCARCDAAQVMGESVIRELGAEKAIRFAVRQKKIWWLLMLFKGFRNAPIFEIDGKVYSEDTVPEKEQLKRYLQSLLI